MGAFNLFNQAYPDPRQRHQDFDMTLQTVCNVRVNGVPNGAGGTADNVCDPRGGYRSRRTRSTTSARSSSSAATA